MSPPRGSGMFIGSKILITRATIGRRSTHVQTSVSPARHAPRGDTLDLRVPPCPPTPFPSARYSCLLIGRTRLELCRACADCFKKAEGSESTSRRCTLQPRYALENIQDYRTRFYRDKWFPLILDTMIFALNRWSKTKYDEAFFYRELCNRDVRLKVKQQAKDNNKS